MELIILVLICLPSCWAAFILMCPPNNSPNLNLFPSNQDGTDSPIIVYSQISSAGSATGSCAEFFPCTGFLRLLAGARQRRKSPAVSGNKLTSRIYVL